MPANASCISPAFCVLLIDKPERVHDSEISAKTDCPSGSSVVHETLSFQDALVHQTMPSRPHSHRQRSQAAFHQGQYTCGRTVL